MTAPVSSRETGIRVVVRSTVDVCDFVDRMDGSLVGELVVRAPRRVSREAGEVRGVVFIEGGRVCWAAARGLARRLTDLLIARSKLDVDAEAMNDLFRQCQEEGVPFGELLVARGFVEADDLRSVLLDHTTECLDTLFTTDSGAAGVAASEASEAGWCARTSGLSYSPRFTFTTAELLARTSRRSLPPQDYEMTTDVERLLRESFLADEQGEWGAAFVRGMGATPLPVVVHGELPRATTDVIRVGKWAASALDLAATFHDDDAFITSSSSRSVFVAWQSPHQAIIAGRMNPQGPARILNQRARARARRARRAPPPGT